MATYSFAAARILSPAVLNPYIFQPFAFLQPFDIYGTEGSDLFDFWNQTPAPGSYFSFHLGGGHDQMHGSPSGDRIDGESGDDNLWGEGGNDVLIGGTGNDDLYGGAANDTLKGGFGNDHLEGGSGNDVLDGGPGSDWLEGGAGADRFVIADKDSIDKIWAFNPGEGDKIDIAALLDSYTNFAGTTAAQAFSQGYFYFVQSYGPSSYDSGYNTTVYIDPDGGAHNSATDFAVVKLLGTNAAELSSLPFIV